jgi:hypothetical protein
MDNISQGDHNDDYHHDTHIDDNIMIALGQSTYGLVVFFGIVGFLVVTGVIGAGIYAYAKETPAQREVRQRAALRARWEQQHPVAFTQVVQGYRTTSDSSRHLTRKINSAVRRANARGYELIGKTTRYNGMGRGGTDVVLTFQRVAVHPTSDRRRSV